MYTVYVLYSPSFKKIYIGYTSDLINRFLSHNELATKGYTLRYRPWIIAHTEESQTKSEAIKREKQLKSGQGRAYIWNIIDEKFISSDGPDSYRESAGFISAKGGWQNLKPSVSIYY
ncbi:MAG: nuclease superfamily protein [Mucilaginibacter sp.]|nr:nuclease superfamily protein [Mucilaginibacter sp.]